MRDSSGSRNVALMAARIATGLAPYDGGVDAFAEAAARAELGLGGAAADLVMVFAGAPNLDHVEDGLDVVRDRLGAGPPPGWGAQGGVGARRASSWCGRRRFGRARSRRVISRRCRPPRARSPSRACPSCNPPTPR